MQENRSDLKKLFDYLTSPISVLIMVVLVICKIGERHPYWGLLVAFLGCVAMGINWDDVYDDIKEISGFMIMFVLILCVFCLLCSLLPR